MGLVRHAEVFKFSSHLGISSPLSSLCSPSHKQYAPRRINLCTALWQRAAIFWPEGAEF